MMGEDSKWKLAECKVFIDGKEVTNFFPGKVQVIEASEANSSRIDNRYEFESEMTLTLKQSHRLMWCMKKLLWQWRWKQFVQGCSRLWKRFTSILNKKKA